MENTTKKTKAMYFEELREMVMAAVTDTEKQDEYLEFIDKQLAALDKRKEDAANRAAKKRAESDAMTDAVYAVLTDELATVDTILEALDDEEATRNRVVARLGKLVKAEKVVRDYIKEDGKKKAAYRLAE